MGLEGELILARSFGCSTNNLAKYRVPLQEDIHDLEVIYVEEHGAIVTLIGVKGVGKIEIVNTAAALSTLFTILLASACAIYL